MKVKHRDSMCFLFSQMTTTLVDAADLHKYTQIEWEKTTNSLKDAVAKAEKAKEKAKKQKEAFENQFAILENEKTALAKAVEEAKTARDDVTPQIRDVTGQRQIYTYGFETLTY